MGELRIIGTSPTLMVGDRIKGELCVTWKLDNEAEKTRAKKLFDKYLKKGWLAIGENAGKKTQVFRFDPTMDKIVLAPLMMGGGNVSPYCSTLLVQQPFFWGKALKYRR